MNQNIYISRVNNLLTNNVKVATAPQLFTYLAGLEDMKFISKSQEDKFRQNINEGVKYKNYARRSMKKFDMDLSKKEKDSISMYAKNFDSFANPDHINDIPAFWLYLQEGNPASPCFRYTTKPFQLGFEKVGLGIVQTAVFDFLAAKSEPSKSLARFKININISNEQDHLTPQIRKEALIRFLIFRHIAEPNLEAFLCSEQYEIYFGGCGFTHIFLCDDLKVAPKLVKVFDTDKAWGV